MGYFCALISSTIMIIQDQSFFIPSKNIFLSIFHGAIVASGLILFSIGSKQLLSGELTMLSLLEVVGGIFWTWLPLFGVMKFQDKHYYWRNNYLFSYSYEFLSI